MLDIFRNDAFNVVALTARVNDLPYVPGQIGQRGYFQEDGVATLTLAVERSAKETLRLVGPTPRGGQGETRTFHDGDLVNFTIPHFQREDSVLADEVQGRRAFGSVAGNDDQVESVLQRIDMKVGVHLRDFDLTVEHQRVGAIKGIITNKAGGVMANLYTTFGITAPDPIVLDLSDEELNLWDLGRQIQYRYEDLIDGPYDGIDAWMGRDAFDQFVKHKYNRDAYKILQDRNLLLGKGPIDEVDLYGINWMRYRTGARATQANAGSPYLAANEVRFVPRVQNSGAFLTRYGPADYMETVNTIGLPRYLKQWAMGNDKGVNLEVQMNVANICTRPDWLIAGTIT